LVSKFEREQSSLAVKCALAASSVEHYLGLRALVLPMLRGLREQRQAERRLPFYGMQVRMLRGER
jgi:hypothetical protein